jgi:hypothetical protein
MPVAPFLVRFYVTQPTADVRTGSLRIEAALGDSVGPLTISIPGLTNGVVAMTAPADFRQYAYEQAGVPPGTYVATIHDASPAAFPPFDTPALVVKPARCRRSGWACSCRRPGRCRPPPCAPA